MPQAIIGIYTIIWWNPDREACHWNDRGRRNQKADITIDNLPFEEPKIELFIYPVTTESKKVIRKSPWKIWALENELGNEKVLKSQSWSLGGSAGSCWGDKHNISPDPQPTSFKEFDQLLEKICPNITFLAYKSVYEQTVRIDNYENSDYYGGSVAYAQYVCDLPKLYDILIERGLIQGVI